MKRNHNISAQGVPNPARRRFVQGLAAGGVLLGLSSSFAKSAWAAPANTLTGNAPQMRGTEFDLVIAETAVNFTGKTRMATTVNGSIPSEKYPTTEMFLASFVPRFMIRTS